MSSSATKRGWRFPGAPEQYRHVVYYAVLVYNGEKGGRFLTADDNTTLEVKWRNGTPEAYHWGTGVEVTADATPPIQKGFKADGGKPDWFLLMSAEGCARALASVVRVLTFGAKKYAAFSWRKVDNAKHRYESALYRHLNALHTGETHDAESGESHWAHVATNALFLAELHEAK